MNHERHEKRRKTKHFLYFIFAYFGYFVVRFLEFAMAEILYKEESYRIIGACFEVYKEMGCGFLEGVYQECLEVELAERSIPFVRQSALTLHYMGRALRQTYCPDFVCLGTIIVELKAVAELNDAHRA